MLNRIAENAKKILKNVTNFVNQSSWCSVAFMYNPFFLTYSNEVKRNRDRILEINYFIDNQREEWIDMQMGLTEAVDPETAALLGDDF